MALAANALTTLTEVKTYLEIDDTSQDSFLERLINSISDFVEEYCNRSFGKSDYTEDYHGDGDKKLFLNQYPVNSVTKVTLNNDEVTDYKIIGERTLHRDKTWISKRDEYYNIQVEYNAGYVLPKDDTTEEPRTLPYDLEDVVIEMVAMKYWAKLDERKGLKDQDQGKVSYSYITDKDLLPEHRTVLQRYKKLVTL